jgi:hypothetical protein
VNCEICKEPVDEAGQHWAKTKDRPDGRWFCHPDRGKCRCAKCDHRWKPREVRIPDRCPACGEKVDLFWADDGGWENSDLKVRDDSFDFSDSDL